MRAPEGSGPVADLVARLEARRSGNGWTAQCPAHDDRTPSLSISEGGDGRILLTCHAGCSTEQIVAAIGWKMADLFAKNGASPSTAIPTEKTRAKPAPTIRFDWDTCVQRLGPAGLKQVADVRGYSLPFVEWLHENKLIGRYEKYFAFPVSGDNGQQVVACHYKVGENWFYFPKGCTTKPFVIGELNDADPIHVFESQWDMFCFLDVSGEQSNVVATRGAGNGRLLADLMPSGATILLWTQNDKAGEDWQEKICASVSATVKRVRVPEQFKDLNDWTKAGATAEDLLGAMVNAETVQAGFPVPEDISDLISMPIVLPDDVILGMLNEGGKMVLGGGSKSFKTWQLIDLATAVATGTNFLEFETRKGAVLYINLELQPGHFSWRVKTVAEKKSVSIDRGFFEVWNLRGYATELRQLLPKILEQAGKNKYALIILDPIYKVLGDREENVTHHITAIMNDLEKIAVQSGAAIAFDAHFSKGNQAGKESIDRISGSGAFARDPDSILIFTRHEEEDAFTVEATLRNHSPVLPFVVRWQFPLMVRDEELDPERLKQTRGAPRKATLNQVLALLSEKPLRATEWQKLAQEELGLGRSTFYSMKKELENLGCVFQVAGLYTSNKPR